MQLYVASFLAWNKKDSLFQIHPGIILATSDDDAIKRGRPAALLALPEADGWTNHQVIVTGVPTPLDLEEYRLTWQIKAL